MQTSFQVTSYNNPSFNKEVKVSFTNHEIGIHDYLDDVNHVVQQVFNQLDTISKSGYYKQIEDILFYKNIVENMRLIEMHTVFLIDKETLKKIDHIANQVSSLVFSLEDVLHKTFKMPIDYGTELEKVEQEIFDFLILKKKKSYDLEKVQKEAFHFFADHFVGTIDSDLQFDLNGNSFSYSLYSLLNILNAYPFPEPSLETLIQDFKGTMVLAKKLHIIRGLQFDGFDYSKFYYEEILKNKDLNNTVLDQPIEKAIVNSSNYLHSVPLSVLIQDFVLEILSQIRQLEPGRRAYFPLGTRTHLILTQIEKNEVNDITYTIFNTGSGNHYHRIKGNYAKPITITGLKEEAFSYDFILNLAKAKFFTNHLSTSKWYMVHYKHFISTNKGNWHKNKGPWYLIQSSNNGTCSYLALEGCVFSQLPASVIQEIEKTKSKITIQKQNVVIQSYHQKKRKIEKENLDNSKLKKQKIKKYNQNINRSLSLLEMAKSFI
jgi:hypothetical protein